MLYVWDETLQTQNLYKKQMQSASEMTYIVSSGALNSTHSLTHRVPINLLLATA